MATTVDDLRNEIRTAVGRFEREASAAFTKEELAAICEAVDATARPGKAAMRAAIREQVADLDDPDGDNETRAFRKADLEAISRALD